MGNYRKRSAKGTSKILMFNEKKTISYQSNTKSFVGPGTKLVTECQPRDEAKWCKTPEYVFNGHISRTKAYGDEK